MLAKSNWKVLFGKQEGRILPTQSRSYGEGCLAAHALDLIGDRWTLLVVRELMLGPRRFGAIRAHLPGIATNMLTTRLEALETAGVIVRTTLPPPASVPVYALTQQGEALWPILEALCHWGAGMPGHDPRLPISPSALMLSMRAQFRPARAIGDHSAGFRLDDEGFLVTIRDGRHTVIRADAPEAALHFAGRPNDVAAVVYGPWPLAESVRRGLVSFTGDVSEGQAFVDLFSLGNPQQAKLA